MAAVFVLGHSACSAIAPAPFSEPARQPTPGQGTASDQHDDPSRDGTSPFSLNIDSPAAAVVGTETVASVSVELQPGWHINLEFPTVLQIEGPQDAPVAKPTLNAADARRFDADHAEFDIVFTAASAGSKQFIGELQFAVCRAESCLPVRAPIVFEVAVSTTP